MTIRQFRPANGGNSLIDQVIAAPLEAAARANSSMAHEQLAFVLKYCFEETSEGKYLPRMINLTITRHEIVEGENGDSELINVEAMINLPVLTIVPLSSLAVEKIEINFDLEVTSMESNSKKGSLKSANSPKSPTGEDKGMSLRGKIGPSRSKTTTSDRKEQSKANLEIKLTAGPLPLPTGILSMIDSFAKHITPHDVKPAKKNASSTTITDAEKT
jgi:hypothetical protein